MRVFVRPSRSEWAGILARPSRPARETIEIVAPVFEAVRSRGDEALRDFTEQYDGVRINDLLVPASALAASKEFVDRDVREAIWLAASNIEAFHSLQAIVEPEIETVPGVKCWRRSLPIESVGLYVPGGSAPLLSTVLMLGIPARIAGCPTVQLCTPPRADGTVHPAILYAAQVAGIERIIRVGGAQAIAAFTYGTASVSRVDKIFGPGNQYVTAAKQYASLEGVAIDVPAGPTEVAIVADQSSPVDFVVYDVLAQAEHGPDSHVVLITTSERYATAIVSAVNEAVTSIPRSDMAAEALSSSVCVVVDGLEEAIELSNAYAPEHLILSVAGARALAAKVRAAGSVFVGMLTPESAGDYASGTNHTLPTGGAARAYSGVSLDTFVNKVTFQEISEEGLRNLGPAIRTLAQAEGLFAHGQSVAVRLEKTDS